MGIVPQISGHSTHVRIDLALGKTIHKGELLFELDRTIDEARRSQLEAEMAVLQSGHKRQDLEASAHERRIADVEKLPAIVSPIMSRAAGMAARVRGETVASQTDAKGDALVPALASVLPRIQPNIALPRRSVT